MAFRRKDLCLILVRSLLIFITPVRMCSYAEAQSLFGSVIDIGTGRPLPLVQVYLAGTTLGDVSDSLGMYKIENIPPGHYTLVASHIGYQPVQQPVRILQDLEQTLFLQPRVIDLPEVQIEGLRDSEWRERLREFESAFLGAVGGEQCRLLNPHVLRLERRGDRLFAYSNQPLEIENTFLGYRVSVIIKSFEHYGDRTTYQVLPFFQPLKPDKKSREAFWQENRRRAYYGSYRHFFHALFSDALEAAGFVVERVDDRRPFSTPLERISSAAAKGKIYSDTEYLLFKKIHFRDYLRIRPLNNYAQTSYLELPVDTLIVDWRGHSLSEPEIVRSGFWGEQRFAEELPWDYLP